MRKLIIISTILTLALLGWGVYWISDQSRGHFDMKAGVIQSATPLSRTAAMANCPIALPESASNIQYAVWSLWQASQTFVRFDAPPSDCLEHARIILQPYAQRTGLSISYTNAIGPLPAPFVVSPEDLTVGWFDLPRFSAGVVFQVSGRAPTVWVDTNRGCFYYGWNE